MKKPVLLLLFVLGISHSVFGQGSFIPERFTNRPLTLFNDATSVGWNPALLGLVPDSDLVLVLPYTRNFEYNGQVGGFYSQDGIGLGITSQKNTQLPSNPYTPFSFYGGYGFPIIENNTWLGASLRYSDFGTSVIRFNGSLIHKPIDDLLISAGMTNFNSVNSADLLYSFSLVYSVFDWLSVLGKLQFTSDSTLFGGEHHSMEFGLCAGARNNVFTTSFMVNPVLREARLGIEFSLGAISLGFLNDASTVNTQSGRFNGGNLLLRYQSDGAEPDHDGISEIPDGLHVHHKTDTVEIIHTELEVGSHDCGFCPHDCVHVICIFCQGITCIHCTVCPKCPDCKPGTVPVTPPVAQPDTPPVAPPVTPPVAPPVTPPVDPPVMPPTFIIEGCEYPYNECQPYNDCPPKVDEIIKFLMNFPDTCITIITHTDSIGKDEDNLRLSECRAESIKEILIDAGIEEWRISTVGRGEWYPLTSNSTPEGRQRNRRVEYQFKPCSWDEVYE